MAYRSQWMDPDFRRDPKTRRFCGLCQRDLAPAQPHRFVLYELDRYEAVHRDDWEAARDQITASRTAHHPVIVEPIGMDCARRLGLEWSRAPEDVPEWALALYPLKTTTQGENR